MICFMTLPKSWRLLYLDGEEWKPVRHAGSYPAEKDQFNRVTCEPAQTRSVRLEVQSHTGKAAGLFEWRVLSGSKNVAAEGRISCSVQRRPGRFNNFIRAINDGEGASQEARLVDVREQHGFTPWYFNLPSPGKGYEVAWKQLMDPQGFYAPFGPTTTEQRHPGFKISYEGHACQWNGPSWPLSTAVTLTALANVLNNYPQDAVTRKDYIETLRIYARSHRLRHEDGRVVSWIDENLNPFTGDWIARTRLKDKKDGTWDPAAGGKERGKDYNHSSYCDLIISGLAGLRPRADDIVEVNPLVTEEWDFFCLDHVLYHGRLLTIVWDKTGEKYGLGRGLRVFADGREIARSERLERVQGRLASANAAGK